MADLNEIASSGASIEVIVELLAKQVEKRLKALENQRGADYESNVEKIMAEVLKNISKMQPNITVQPTKTEAPIINVAAPSVIIDKNESKTIKLTFERNLQGTIESATIIKE